MSHYHKHHGVFLQNRVTLLNLCQQDVVEGILNVDMAATQSDDFLHYASGGRLFAGSVPLVHRYGGHQVQFDTLLLLSTLVQVSEYIRKFLQIVKIDFMFMSCNRYVSVIN